MDKLLEGARQLGFPLSPEEARRFGLYLAELLKWNAKVNLTAITEPDEIIVKHFLDSLVLRRILPDFVGMEPDERIGAPAAEQSAHLSRFIACDIGSGAGFPGLALKIVLPGMELTLVEPIHKKAAFLRQAARMMGLTGVTVLEARSEDLPGKIAEHPLSTRPADGLALPRHQNSVPAPFDIVFSRAFKAPDELLPLAAPILKTGGRVALSLGSATEYGLRTGWTLEREEDITLPFSDIRRRLILLKKS